MELFQVNQHEDSKYDINWVVVNNPVVMINRKYIERHEPTYSGVSIVVQNPDDDDWLMEYGSNEEGFMSVSDFTKRGRMFELIRVDAAIQELVDNVNRALEANK